MNKIFFTILLLAAAGAGYGLHPLLTVTSCLDTDAACSSDKARYYPVDPPVVRKAVIGHGDLDPHIAPCPQFNLEFRSSDLTTTSGYFYRFVVFGHEMEKYAEAHMRNMVTEKMVVWMKDSDPRYTEECEIHVEFTRKIRPRASDRHQKDRIFFPLGE